jgi:hypothetical protein
LCKVKGEKKFEARLKELFEQFSEKSKWTLAFDDGGSRYEVMTTNISEVFNFILKGIRSLSVSNIVDYTFHKCNE